MMRVLRNHRAQFNCQGEGYPRGEDTRKEKNMRRGQGCQNSVQTQKEDRYSSEEGNDRDSDTTVEMIV